MVMWQTKQELPYLAPSIDEVHDHSKQRKTVARRPRVKAEVDESERCSKKVSDNSLEVVKSADDRAADLPR